jgi:hypothetical protein
MQQTPTTSTTVTEQTDRANAPDRAPLGLRGGLDYDHPGTGLLSKFIITHISISSDSFSRRHLLVLPVLPVHGRLLHDARRHTVLRLKHQPYAEPVHSCVKLEKFQGELLATARGRLSFGFMAEMVR